MKKKTNKKYPYKKVIINRISGYIDRIKEQKIPRAELDTLYILENIIKVI